MSNSYVLEQWPHGFLVRILAPPSLIVTHISFRGFLSAEVEHARIVDGSLFHLFRVAVEVLSGSRGGVFLETKVRRSF